MFDRKHISKRRGGRQRHARRFALPTGRCLRRTAAAYLLVAAVAGLGWLYTSLPSCIYVEQGQPLQLARFSWVQPLQVGGAQNVLSTQAAGSYRTTLCIGGILPVKTVRTVVAQRPLVTVCGTPFGVKMFSQGALVVGFSDLDAAQGGTTNPAKEAGLRLGDRVVCMNGEPTQDNDAVRKVLESSQGQPVQVSYVRNGEQYAACITPVRDLATGQWMAGMWVRDSSAGVGTLTFVAQNGIFAGLGHSISDSDTGESIALRSGEIVPCEIVSYTAGAAGEPGELKGQFTGAHATGVIRINGAYGVYGMAAARFEGAQLPLAFAQEVATGPAEVWTTIQGSSPKAYTAQIEKISDAAGTRNLVIRITDSELLQATGGIVQGMSGSPILQNGRLVGAVTHVLINDPTRGYGIFAETMLQQADSLAARSG